MTLYSLCMAVDFVQLCSSLCSIGPHVYDYATTCLDALMWYAETSGSKFSQIHAFCGLIGLVLSCVQRRCIHLYRHVMYILLDTPALAIGSVSHTENLNYPCRKYCSIKKLECCYQTKFFVTFLQQLHNGE